MDVFISLESKKRLVEAIENAQEALGMSLILLEDEKQNIPSPTDIRSITLEDHEFVTLFLCDSAASAVGHVDKVLADSFCIHTFSQIGKTSLNLLSPTGALKYNRDRTLRCLGRHACWSQLSGL